MKDDSHNKYTKLPPLTDEFLFQIIFCMEDQANEYYIDLKQQNICESVFIEQRIESDPDRFISIPEWLPSDGFHTMEKFISTLRNPIYRERLKNVLLLGKGVFRQFKDVLHEQPSIERLWYYFKDKEMRNKIYEWYDLHDTAFSLASLKDQGPDDDTLDVIKEDFTISEDLTTHKDVFEQFRKECLQTYNDRQNPYSFSIYQDVEKAWKMKENYFALFALTTNEDVVATLFYHLDPLARVVEIKAYYIIEEYRGIGLFHLLFDSLCVKMKAKGVDDLILDFYEGSLQIESMFKEITTKNIKKSVYLSISSWIDSIK